MQTPGIRRLSIGRTFSTENDQQYETIGAFWDELAAKYGRENLQGLGYGWKARSIEYVLGLIDGEIDGEDRTVTLPDMGWVTVRGRTADLGKIYEKIYQEGRLEYEIERFTDSGDCEIMYCRSTDRKSTRLNSSHIATSRMPSSA